MMKRGLIQMRIVLALSLLASWVSPAAAQLRNPEAMMQLDGDPDVQRAFARDLRAGLIVAQLDPSDVNMILLPLVEAGITRRVSGPDAVPRLHSQSLETISNRRRDLLELFNRLRDKYDIVELQSVAVGDSLLLPEDSPHYPPALSSWLDLRSLRQINNFPVSRSYFVERKPEPEPLKWIVPLRIAATGNAVYDQAVAAALARLRAATPGLPIDDASFPVPVDQANMFIANPLVICAEDAPCHPMPPGSPLEKAQGALALWASWYSLEPLFFFDALRGDRWVAGLPIYRLRAVSGNQTGTVAWVRTDGHGHITTAFCDWVAEPRRGGLDPREEQWSPEKRESVTALAQHCIAAALGAPTELSPSWFKSDYESRGHPVDQGAGLRQLYGRR